MWGATFCIVVHDSLTAGTKRFVLPQAVVVFKCVKCSKIFLVVGQYRHVTVVMLEHY